MTLEEMMTLCESRGCYWTLKSESVFLLEYACEIFCFREVRFLAQVTAGSPAEAFAKALKEAKIEGTIPPCAATG